MSPERLLCRNFETVSIQSDHWMSRQSCLICERTVGLNLNGAEMIHLLCLPIHLEYLALGFFYTEGIITDKNQIESIQISEDPRSVNIQTNGYDQLKDAIYFKRTVTSGCGKGMIFRNVENAERPSVTSVFSIPLENLFGLSQMIRKEDSLYRRTRGVHSSVLCGADGIVYFSPDIGRHNTIDRVAGKCFWEGISVEDKVLFCTGRFSSEMVLKLGSLGVPIAISRSTPTDIAVELAQEIGITLATTKSMRKLTIYSHPERILK